MLQDTLFGTLLALLTTLPLAWKWQLGVRRTAFFVSGLSVLSAFFVTLLPNAITINPLAHPVLVWLLTLAGAFVMVAYLFFRDPERTAPVRDDVIVSPADGKVLYIRAARSGVLPVSTKDGRNYRLHELTKAPLHSAEAVVIGIGMTFLDVHVNRAPIAGQITLQRHFPGRFGSLRRPEMAFENERATTLIERGGLQVAIVQIASRLVRQIVPFVREGQEVLLGQRIGVIRFGSQVDLVLPARDELNVVVRVGEQVIAGESIIASLGPASGEVATMPDTLPSCCRR